mmetsp:Transcript_94078/g.248565  ORF Transcript_94078/g.248565 Transcript_94078/m.248565 type:complete len:396 (-) Transcript_94078:152-1339(-)
MAEMRADSRTPSARPPTLAPSIERPVPEQGYRQISIPTMGQASHQTLSSMFSACLRATHVADHLLCCLDQDGHVMMPKRDEPSAKTGFALTLRIGYAPGVDSSGAMLGPFGIGDDVAVSHLEACEGYEPMTWRQGSAAASSSSRCPLQPEDGQRFNRPHDFYRARVRVSNGKGGFEEYWCLLSTAADPNNRTIENVKVAVDDAVITASYAHRFNEHTARLQAEHEGGGQGGAPVIGLRVCVPVGCHVMGSTAPKVGGSGQALSLALFPFKQVQKFVFNGSEDFTELPQAFFHYCHHISAGGEVIMDIQGIEDEDGDVYIVDPAIIRPAAPSVGHLIGSIVTGAVSSSREGEDRLRFNTWHPRCSQLCKAFDPTRKSAHCRRSWGCATPTCGTGGT